MSETDNVLSKYADEDIKRTCDFSDAMAASGEAISAVTVIVKDNAGTVVTDDIVHDAAAEGSDQVVFWAKDGTYDASPYKIEVDVATNAQPKIILFVFMNIKKEGS